MKLHSKENMKVNGLELLKMLSLMANSLTGIENYYSQNTNILEEVRPVPIISCLPTLVERVATPLFVCLKLLHKHKDLQLNRW